MSTGWWPKKIHCPKNCHYEVEHFEGREFRTLVECPSEVLELWNLLRSAKRAKVKKVYAIAKVLMS